MALPPATYPAKEITGIVAFLHNVATAFDSEPAVRDEFFALVTGFGEGRGDAGAVVARATEILGGRRDLLAQFRACLIAGAEPPNGGLAPTRPRRSNRSRPVVVAEEQDVSDGDVVYDEREENRLRRKREREQARRAAKRAAAAGGGGVAHREEEDPRLPNKAPEPVSRVNKRAAGVARREEEDPRLSQAVVYVRQVKKRGGPEVACKFIQVMKTAQNNVDMTADAIYDGARKAFGPAHDDLLHSFAMYLPGEAEWEEQEERRCRDRKRRHAAGGHETSVAAKKKPRGRSSCDEASARGGRDGEKHLPLKAKNASIVGECSGASRGHEEHDVARYRADKKPGNAVVIGEGGSGNVARVQSADTNNRRASITGDGAGSAAEARTGGEVGRFRALWEFATRYSILTATMSRTEELTKLHADEEPTGGDDNVGSYSLDLEKLFPSRDSRKLLERLYGDRWRMMKRGLQDGGLVGRALRVVLDSLRWAEDMAVQDAMQCRDRARAAEALKALVMDRLDEERRRGNAAR